MREPQQAAEERELLATIADLPDEFRDVLVAVDVTGLSYKEASGLLGVPEGTVMSRLYRARKRVIAEVGTLELQLALGPPAGELGELRVRHARAGHDARAAVALPGDGGLAPSLSNRWIGSALHLHGRASSGTSSASPLTIV